MTRLVQRRAGQAESVTDETCTSGAGIRTLIVSPPGAPVPTDITTIPFVQLTGDAFRDVQTVVRRMNEMQNASPAKPPTFETAEAALRAAVHVPSALESLSPSEFEQLVMDLFKERGYTVSPTKDDNVDFSIKSQTDQRIVPIEVKKLSRHSRVSVEAVRNLLSVVTAIGAPMGVLVSSSGYTAAAIALASGAPVILRTIEQLLAARSEKELLNISKFERR